MTEFLQKIAHSLPVSPPELKLFDSLSQCEHLLFDASIKQAFLLPLFHFLRKKSIQIQFPLAPASLCPPNAGSYKYWVQCEEGLDLLNKMAMVKKEDGSLLYHPADIDRFRLKYGKTWWKIPQGEYQKVQKMIPHCSPPFTLGNNFITVEIEFVNKKTIDDKLTKEEIVMLIPQCKYILPGYVPPSSSSAVSD